MRKELVFKKTEHACFISLLNNDISIADSSDFVGTYAVRDGKNYVCGVNELILPSTYVNGWGDNFDTLTKDGFDYGEEMFIFHYDSQQDKFFKVNPGFILKQTSELTPTLSMTFAPLAMYLVISPSIGEEITLEIDEELTRVELTGSVSTEPIKVAGFDSVQLSYTAINTTQPQFFVALGNGTIVGDKYMFASSDTNVVINIVASDIFTNELLTSQIKFTIDQSIGSSTIFENNDYFLYVKTDKLICKSKDNMIIGRMYSDVGKLFRSIMLRPNTETIVIPNSYPNYKGRVFVYVYDVWKNGKKITTEPISNHIKFI